MVDEKHSVNDRVLVLDGDTRAALAVVRSLRKLDLEIGVAADRRTALGASSRGASVYFPVAKPRRNRSAFVAQLNDIIVGWRPQIIFPVTDASLDCLRDLPAATRAMTIIPSMTGDVLDGILEKDRLLEHSAKLGLHTPRSMMVPTDGPMTPELDARITEFSFPAVMKPCRSEAAAAQPGVPSALVPVCYPETPGEAFRMLARYAGQGTPVLLQQRIVGPGVGVFCLCDNGEPLVTFCHRRILEKPPTGGPSVLCESIPTSEAPVDQAHRLLRSFRWDGIAMVEFKQHVDGRFYLMEINPRFWGSLQLAIDAGCDFPVLLYSWALSRSGRRPMRIEPVHYRPGIRLRWTLGTVDHLLIRLRHQPWTTLQALCSTNPLQLFSPKHPTRNEVFRMSDPVPGIFEWVHWFGDIFG